MAEVLVLAVGAAALLLALGGTLHAARWARAPVAPASAWRPFATVIVPCKGEHPGFEANVRALLAQDYPADAHEFLFVVDDAGDPAARALDAMAPRLPEGRARVLHAAPQEVGADWATGKVVAQLTGVARASPRSEVLVFADADARPAPTWLACMVAPLADPALGAVTGYRWYMAPPGAGDPGVRATWWTALRDAWNAVGLDAMTMPRFRFLWGGSMAVRRADFARSDVREEWRWRVSEDVGLTRAVQRLGLGVAFAPGAIVASPEAWTGDEVREWVVRQSALTLAAMPGLFRFAQGVYALSVALLGVGLGLAAAWPTPALGLAGLMMLAPVLTAWPRALLRERLVRRALPLAREQPGRERAMQLLLSGAVPLFMLWTLRRAGRVRAITWRGRTYALRADPGPR